MFRSRSVWVSTLAPYRAAAWSPGADTTTIVMLTKEVQFLAAAVTGIRSLAIRGLRHSRSNLVGPADLEKFGPDPRESRRGRPL